MKDIKEKLNGYNYKYTEKNEKIIVSLDNSMFTSKISICPQTSNIVFGFHYKYLLFISFFMLILSIFEMSKSPGLFSSVTLSLIVLYLFNLLVGVWEFDRLKDRMTRL